MVHLFGAEFEIEGPDKYGKYIDLGTEKIYVKKDNSGEYVMMNDKKYPVGGRTRNRRKRRSRKYKK